MGEASNASTFANRAISFTGTIHHRDGGAQVFEHAVDNDADLVLGQARFGPGKASGERAGHLR
jgi:hypothetical protein